MNGHDESRGGGGPEGGLSPLRRERILAGLEPAPAGLGAAELESLEADRAAGEAFLRRRPPATLSDRAQFGFQYPAVDKAGAETPPKARILRFPMPRVYALAAVLIALLLPVLVVYTPERLGDLESKGAPFFTLFVNGRSVAADQAIPAGAGDTLQFLFHHSGPARYALYYRDDGGPWLAYIDPHAANPSAPHGEPLAHSIVLDGGWREEILAAVAGPDAAPGAANPGWIACLDGLKAAGCEGVVVNRFRLVSAPQGRQ